jgi:hypothetical protein
MSSPLPRIHFGPSFEEAPSQKQKIQAVLQAAATPHSAPDEVPAWIVVKDVIEGTSTYIAHHTPSQFTITARTAEDLCQRVGEELEADTRYDGPSFRLDGRPDTRPDHGPGRTELDASSDQ